MKDIWLYVQHRDGAVEEPTYGLTAEARRLRASLGGGGLVTAVVLGNGPVAGLEEMGFHGADRVLVVDDERLAERCRGDVFARALAGLAERHGPACVLMAQTAETLDLGARSAALLETAFISRVMDLQVDEDGVLHAHRPVANGYLFERLRCTDPKAPIIAFLPAVLAESVPEGETRAEVLAESMGAVSLDGGARVLRVEEADPGELDIEEADIVVCGGRGVGRDADFDIIHRLARAIDGSVAGTRPIIDWQTLPYERQIGQTGKTVMPRLIVNCGISGANEYTAGMEKAQVNIAVNTDPRARIFRFADLGVVADIHRLLPHLCERLEALRGHEPPAAGKD
ncbi:MAG: electron transfer flavoprotein subunit alpha/FixB family protein [Deltaproteobacteria bacterium]|nr:electron transfer flavoprotein subunit alpha/FixB family protein [Candidatus Anaeroferrophillacea bacterium]